jgi:hypothetical protein
MGIPNVCTMCEKPWDKHDDDCPVGMAEKAELAGLPEYSLSLPTWTMHDGKVLGVRRWKRRTPTGWLIGEITIVGEDITLHWSTVPKFKPERLRLWRTNFSGSAYKDQFGRGHEGHIVVEEVDVTIVERKPAIGLWGRKLHEGMAARAVDAAGKEYFCNWDGSFADDSPTPMWMWYDRWESSRVASIFTCVYPDGRAANPNVGEPGLKDVGVDMAKGSDQTASVLYFMERPVDGMTREELIEALKLLAQPTLLRHGAKSGGVRLP